MRSVPEVMSEDLGEEDIVGDVFGFELVNLWQQMAHCSANGIEVQSVAGTVFDGTDNIRRSLRWGSRMISTPLTPDPTASTSSSVPMNLIR